MGLLEYPLPMQITELLLVMCMKILRTIDGGDNWVSQTSGITRWLFGVSFTDVNNGTAVGEFGTILRATDGGDNWISQTGGTTAMLYGVSFTDANNGTAVGEGGKNLRRTTEEITGLVRQAVQDYGFMKVLYR